SRASVLRLQWSRIRCHSRTRSAARFRATRIEDLMIRLAFVLLALTALTPALAQPATASAELTGEARSHIDAAIDKAITEQRLVGAVVLVSRDGKLVYQRAVGLADREAK